MSELKPCPFCGGEVRMTSRLFGSDADGFDVRRYYVRCRECDVGFIHLSPVQVAELWNRRTTKEPNGQP